MSKYAGIIDSLMSVNFELTRAGWFFIAPLSRVSTYPRRFSHQLEAAITAVECRWAKRGFRNCHLAVIGIRELATVNGYRILEIMHSYTIPMLVLKFCEVIAYGCKWGQHQTKLQMTDMYVCRNHPECSPDCIRMMPYLLVSDQWLWQHHCLGFVE